MNTKFNQMFKSTTLAAVVALTLGVGALTAPVAVVHAQAAKASTPIANEAPDVMVKRLSDDVIASVKADKDIQAGDTRKLLDLVDNKILPYVDFPRMTRLTVGRAWREATPAQQEALIREFRTTLVRTYAGAVRQISDQTIQLRPMRAEATDTDVVVRTVVQQAKGDPIQLDYRVIKQTAGWKIYDVNVLGVWLVETYKNQFAQEINAKGIDGLIATLADRNRNFDKAKK